MAERILRCSLRIEAIADDLVKRPPDASPLTFEPSRIDLIGAVREVVESFGALCQEKGIDLSFSPAVEVAELRGDARRIQQAVANLVGNAVAHVRAGGRIQVLIFEGPSEAVVLVIDDGIGFAPEHRERVFEKGFQVADGRQGSRGLGLYIVKLVAEAHGGGAWARSEGPGRGATFCLSLPRVAPAASRAISGAPWSVPACRA